MKRNMTYAALAAIGMLTFCVAHAQISDNVVKIGVMNDLSGPFSEIAGPGSVVAAKMAVEDFLQTSKSNLQVQVVSASHQNKPDVGSVIARKWSDTEGVDMIVDVPVSSVALAVNQVAKEKGKAYINTGAGSPDLMERTARQPLCIGSSTHGCWRTARTGGG